MAKSGYGFIRPESARSFLSSDGMIKVPIKDCLIVPFTTPAAAAALPVFTAVVQEFTSGDPIQTDCVCSGTWIQVGDTFACLAHDAQVSLDADYIIKADKILVAMVAGQTASQGNLCYMNATTFECTTIAANGEPIGIFLESANQTPAGLPTGLEWALISFDGRSNIWQS